VPKWISLGLIIVIFIIAFIYAKAQGPVERAAHPVMDEASELIAEEQTPDANRRP